MVKSQGLFCADGMLDPTNKDNKDLPLTIRAVFIVGPDKKLKLSLNCESGFLAPWSPNILTLCKYVHWPLADKKEAFRRAIPHLQQMLCPVGRA